MAMLKKNTKVVTGLVRFSYASVLEPRDFDGDEKYQVSLIIPKKDKDTLAKIEEAVKNATERGKDKWEGFQAQKTPLRDGDEERPDDEAYAGCYFLNATSKRKPQVIDKDGNAIYDPHEFYSGCYGRASVNFFPFNRNGNKGIAAGLNNVQKLVDGPSLSSYASASEDFADMPDIDINEDDLPF